MQVRKIVCLLMSVIVYAVSYAQQQQYQTPQQHQQQGLTPVSPEAAALAKMVNYPVNLNTGVPDISIPLYTIKSAGLTLPITLQYHAGGFKINEHSGRVGLGWSLTCDLQITRSVNGRSDFGEGGWSYLQNSKIKCHIPGDFSTNYPLGFNDWRDIYRFSDGSYDGMPDKFHYKLLNKSGSFYFRKNEYGSGYTIVTVPFEPIRIEYDNGVFIITDTDGTVYNFGVPGSIGNGGVAPILKEYTNNSLVTTWKCSRIQNARNTEAFDFIYANKPVELFSSSNESIVYYSTLQSPGPQDPYYTSDYFKSEYPSNTTFESTTGGYPFWQLSSPKYFEHRAGKPSVFHLPYVRTHNDGSYEVEDNTYPLQVIGSGSTQQVEGCILSKIYFNGGEVEFVGVNQLSSIRVKDNNDNVVKSFDFFHTESSTYQPNVPSTLYLDRIEAKTNAGELYERYDLLYKNKYPFGDGLLGKDAWGYANKFTANYESYPAQSSIPNQKIIQQFIRGYNLAYENITFSIGNTVNTELADKEGTQRGILQRIVYPTGGYADFDFESNKFKEFTADGSPAIQMGAGLRIRTISQYNGKDVLPVSQKYYKYGEYEDGIGQLAQPLTKIFDGTKFQYDAYSYTQEEFYFEGIRDQYTYEPCSGSHCLKLRGREKKTTYLPASAHSNTYPHGAAIYYTKVTEYNSDLGKETGKTVHLFYEPFKFTPQYPGKIDGTNIDYMRPDGLMGQQKRLEEYKYVNGHYTLVHSKEFAYEKYSQREMIKVIYAFNPSSVSITNANFVVGEDLYDPTKTIGDYPYPLPGLMAGQYGIEVGKLLLVGETEKWITEAGELTQQTNYQYNPNYLQPHTISTTRSDGSLLTKKLKYCYDFAGDPVYAQMLANNMITPLIEEELTGTSGPISTTKTNYTVFNEWFIAPQSVQTSFGGKPLTTELLFDKYDNKGNLLQSTGKDGIVTTYLWGYYETSLLAKITGLNYESATSSIDMAVLRAQTDENQLRNVFSNLRTTHANAFITSFTHKPLVGVGSTTDPNGQTRFFEYDGAGRLVVVKDNNQSIVQSFKYNMTNELTYLAGDNWFVPRHPNMESFNLTEADGTKKIYNITSSNGQAILDEYVAQYQPSEKDGLAVADVLIQLNAWFAGCDPYSDFSMLPIGFHLDLLKNGSVVYTKEIKCPIYNPLYREPIELYIPHGEYQVNLRLDENFNNLIMSSYFYSPAGFNQPENDFILKQPVTINFVPGITYSITSLNY